MPEFIAIAIPSTPGFYLIGQSSGPLGEIAGDLSASFVDIASIAGPFESAPAQTAINGAPCHLTLARPVRIPGGLVEGSRLRNTGELSAALAMAGNSRGRFLAQVAEAQRRMLSVEVNAGATGTAFLGIASPFGRATAFAGAHVRLGLWAMASGGAAINLQVDVELAAYSRIAVAGLERAVSLVIVLGATADAALRIDADDFGLRFPRFSLPSFDLRLGPMLLDLQNGLDDALSTLKQFNIEAPVKVSHTNASPADSDPKLVLKSRPAQSGIDWAVVPSDFDPNAEDIATSEGMRCSRSKPRERPRASSSQSKT